MPLLVFRCECGHEPERLFPPWKAPEVEETTCELCGKIAERILATPAPAQFKGSGFYATDYKGK